MTLPHDGADALCQAHPFVSFEFFPPKTDAGERNLFPRVDRMAQLFSPLFIDVTCYGWTTQSRRKSLALAIALRKRSHHYPRPTPCKRPYLSNRCGSLLSSFSPRTKETVMLHMTTLNLNRTSAAIYLDEAVSHGLNHFLVLQGDPCGRTVRHVKEGFLHAVDLVRFMRERYGGGICIGVAGDHTYRSSRSRKKDPVLPPAEGAKPERPGGCSGDADSNSNLSDGLAESSEAETSQDEGEGRVEQSVDEYMRLLKDKVDAGADFIVTQCVNNVESYVGFLASCRRTWIDIPIIPGVLPVTNYALFEKVMAMHQIPVPEALWEALRPIKEDDDKVKDFGVQHGLQLGQDLLAAGAPSVHFFTMNLEQTVSQICRNIGCRELSWQMASCGPSGSQAREDEVVRPIFWSNRPYSYVIRSTDWDEYPNGRWGDSRSPAYGEPYLAGSYSGTREERRALWGACPVTEKEIWEVISRFLEGVVARTPWCTSSIPVEGETESIRKELIKLNHQGFLTINSQPPINGKPSDDPSVGWGPSEGWVYQKGYLECFVAPELFEALLETFPQFPKLTYHAINAAGESQSNCDTVTAVTWGVFPGREIVQPTVVDPASFSAWAEEAFALWKQWESIYEKGSVSRQLIERVRKSYWLINIVDNDFTSETAETSLFNTLLKIVEE